MPDREENPDPGPARNRPTPWRDVAGRKKGLDRDVAIREPLRYFGWTALPNAEYLPPVLKDFRRQVVRAEIAVFEQWLNNPRAT
jgi:hypothetical protein